VDVNSDHVTRSAVATCHNVILLLIIMAQDMQNINSTTLTHYNNTNEGKIYVYMHE